MVVLTDQVGDGLQQLHQVQLLLVPPALLLHSVILAVKR